MYIHVYTCNKTDHYIAIYQYRHHSYLNIFCNSIHCFFFLSDLTSYRTQWLQKLWIKSNKYHFCYHYCSESKVIQKGSSSTDHIYHVSVVHAHVNFRIKCSAEQSLIWLLIQCIKLCPVWANIDTSFKFDRTVNFDIA